MADCRWPRMSPVPPEVGVAQAEGDARREQQAAEQDEDLEGLVHRVDAQDGGGAALHVLPGRGEEAATAASPCDLIGRLATAMRFLPAWMIDSRV